MSYIPRLTIKSTARTADFMSSLPNYLGKVIHYLKIQTYAAQLCSERNGIKFSPALLVRLSSRLPNWFLEKGIAIHLAYPYQVSICFVGIKVMLLEKICNDNF